jgi:2-polyprenyl-3-methyl-5-hydroxy-6-metoxy-1,4-benzoquinol methylase
MPSSSLERIYPDTESCLQEIAGQETLKLHLEKYHFAGKNLIPGLVADIAGGAGYGSYLIATEYGQRIKKIFAIDNNNDAISYAKKKYNHPLIDFRLMDAFDFEPAEPLSTIISLETIEHLPNPEEFVKKLSGWLAKGGRLIASVPVTPSVDANPYHLQDFTISSFKRIFSACGLLEVESFIQVQPYNPFHVTKKGRDRGKEIRRGLFMFYLKHPDKFWLRIKSIFKDGFKNKYLVVVFEKPATDYFGNTEHPGPRD